MSKASILTFAVGAAVLGIFLLDLHLPDSRDLGLLRTIRRLSPASAVILMTAYGTPETVQGALDLGADRVVPKPFDLSDMLELVRRAQPHASRRVIDSPLSQ